LLNVPRIPLPDLDAKVDFLSTPSSYPELPRSVEARETHMSWVFMTDRHAFKLKKPVKTSFLDFSTLDLRKHFCEEEVRLNRDLAPGVYVGVVPLGKDREAGLRLGEGEPVEYLVQMVRLPAAATLEAAILDNRVEEQTIRNLAKHLATFYRQAPVLEIEPAAYRRRLTEDLSANAEAMLKPGYGLPAAQIKTTADVLSGFAARHGEVFEKRAGEGRIVDAHGDLRPEHIYFLPDRIVVIDRLEFNAAFRALDPVDELAYLAMECERAGVPVIGSWLFETYCAESGDRPSPELISFYMGARALLRAKLAIWHLDTPHPRTPEKWPLQARAYLDLAEGFAAKI